MPRVPETAFTEQEGVIKVATVVNDARCVWRETPTRDVGIDGQIEYIDPQGEATGRIVAIQVKSGPSYFEHASQVSVPYSPSSLHRRYWERFPLPVVLVLYEPSSDTAVWADARAALRARPDGPIHVPRRQVFDETGVLEALQAEGPLPVGPTDPSHLMWLLLAEEIDVGDCRVSFFDLFFQGLTNAASWAVYFGMDLFDEVVRAKLAVLRSRGGFFITAETYDFIDRYVGFLTAYDIARVDNDWFIGQARLQQLVGTILAPLTTRGRDLVAFVAGVDAGLSGEGSDAVVVRERSVQMVITGEVLGRTARIEFFKTCLPGLTGPLAPNT